MEGEINNFQQTIMFIVVMLVAGWYVFSSDNDDHGGWGNRK